MNENLINIGAFSEDFGPRGSRMPSNSAGKIEELKDIKEDSLYEGMDSPKN